VSPRGKCRFEYVSLQSPNRYRFLQNVLERRFAHLDQVIDFLTCYRSARSSRRFRWPALSRGTSSEEDVYYHGLDTISDLCSGDFATGIDIVRRIFEQGRSTGASRRWSRRQSKTQRFANTQSRIRIHSVPFADGRHKYDIADGCVGCRRSAC